MKSKSLKFKFMVYVGLLVVILSLGLGVSSYLNTSSAIKEEVETRLPSKAEDISMVVRSRLDIIKAELEAVASRSEIKSMDWEEIKPVLAAEKNRTEYATIALVEPDGTTRYPDNDSLYLGDRGYVQEAFAGSSNISDILVSRVTEEPVVMAAAPVTEDGEVVGVLIARLLANDIINIIGDIEIGEAGFAYMINDAGNVVAHRNIDFVMEQFNPISAVENENNFKQLADISGFEQLAGNNGAESLAEDFTAMINNQSGFRRYNSLEGKDSYLGYNQVPGTNWMVAVSIPVDQVLNNLYSTRNSIFLITIPILIITLLIMFIEANSLTAPLNSLSQVIKRMSKFDLSYRRSDDKSPANPRIDFDLDNVLEKTKLIDCNISEILDIKSSFVELVHEIDYSYKQLESYNEEITSLNEKLGYLAEHDPLTELPNRRKFKQVLNQELEQEEPGAVFLFDLDNFKEINDTKGHVFGDRVLKKVGRKLAALKNDKLFVSRYGGDEFLLLVRLNNKTKVETYIEQIREALEQPLLIDDNFIHLGFSLGVAYYPDDSRNVDQLITYADTAMYQAKKSQKGHSLFFQDYMKTELETKNNIKGILRQALKEDGFELVYQPEVDLISGQASVLEALLRLKNYDISPGVFIPIAEESNLIVEIGRWVTKEAVRQLVKWRQQGLELKPVAINFSVNQLNDKGYLDFLENRLQSNDLSPDLIEIEITESIFLENKKETIKFLDKLKDLGVKLVLDDFGTGYSSISYLSYVPVDKIKLDRSLIDRYLQFENLQSLKKLIAFFRSMDLQVVTEGIEEKEEYLLLSNCACNLVQGYFFSKPMEVSKLEQVYNRNYIKRIV
ncbi:MAG: EAL domain-containing protein [Halarsenatibacteraceae bacterium]